MRINALSEVFSSILFNISDYESQLKNISTIFFKTIQDIDEKNFISINFLNEYKNYPKYPIDFKVIDNLNKYNVLTIYNSAQNDINWLLDAITKPEILNLKNRIDTIPETNIKEDYGLQTTFFTEIGQSFFSSLFFNGLSVDSTRQNYLYKTFGYSIPSQNKEFSFILLYSIYLFVLRNMRYSLRLFENIFSSKAQILRLNDQYSKSFSSYIDQNDKYIAESLVKFILVYTYKISSPSGTFLSEIVEIVRKKIHDLKIIFNDAISIRDSITSNIILYSSDLFYNFVASKFANSTADLELGIFNSTLLETLRSYEIDIINNVFNKYSAESFREYLYLVYYYKLNPKKFLNTLQLMIMSYTMQELIDRNQSFFNISILQSYFYKIFGTINKPPVDGLKLNVIEEYLNEIVNPNYIIDTMEQERICEFATRVKMVTYFEDIFSFSNKKFDSFIDEIYEEIFNYLKKTVQIDPYYEFFFNRKMLFWYLLSYFKRDVLLNKIFNKEEIQISEIFYDLLTNPTYKINFNIEKMRSRTVQYIEGNITNIGNLFENIIETAVDKKLFNENITYFLN